MSEFAEFGIIFQIQWRAFKWHRYATDTWRHYFIVTSHGWWERKIFDKFQYVSNEHTHVSVARAAYTFAKTDQFPVGKSQLRLPCRRRHRRRASSITFICIYTTTTDSNFRILCTTLPILCWLLNLFTRPMGAQVHLCTRAAYQRQLHVSLGLCKQTTANIIFDMRYTHPNETKRIICHESADKQSATMFWLCSLFGNRNKFSLKMNDELCIDVGPATMGK